MGHWELLQTHFEIEFEVGDHFYFQMVINLQPKPHSVANKSSWFKCLGCGVVKYLCMRCVLSLFHERWAERVVLLSNFVPCYEGTIKGCNFSETASKLYIWTGSKWSEIRRGVTWLGSSLAHLTLDVLLCSGSSAEALSRWLEGRPVGHCSSLEITRAWMSTAYFDRKGLIFLMF